MRVWLLALLAFLAGCTTATPANLPLAADQPTFLYFYTDG